MPLHLLQKKSWNPYNPAAIARVRADEEAAQAREEAEEQLQQQQDAKRRLAILRGVTPPLLEDAPASVEKRKSHSGPRGIENSHRAEWRKKRRLAGEDDTDRDIRLARQDAVMSRSNQVLQDQKPNKGDAVSLTDSNGHIQLFTPSQQTAQDKNAEAEMERKKTQRELEDQYSMRFSNAAGFKQAVDATPWYTNTPKININDEEASHQLNKVRTNVWGREDEGRMKRDEARITSADPMAAMKKAQSRLQTVKRDRDRWRLEKEREIAELREEEQRHHRRHRHRESKKRLEDEDELEGFSLDAAGPSRHDERRRGHRKSSDRQHRRRSRSPER